MLKIILSIMLIFVLSSCANLTRNGFYKTGGNGQYTAGTKKDGKNNGLVISRTSTSRSHKGRITKSSTTSILSNYEFGKLDGPRYYHNSEYQSRVIPGRRKRRVNYTTNRSCYTIWNKGHQLPFTSKKYTNSNSKQSTSIETYIYNIIGKNYREDLCSNFDHKNVINFYKKDRYGIEVGGKRISGTRNYTWPKENSIDYINENEQITRIETYNSHIPYSLKMAQQNDKKVIEYVENKAKKSLYKVIIPFPYFKLNSLNQDFLRFPIGHAAPYSLTESSYKKIDEKIGKAKKEGTNSLLTRQQLDDLFNSSVFKFTPEVIKVFESLFKQSPKYFSQHFGTLYNYHLLESYPEYIAKNFNLIEIYQGDKLLPALKTKCKDYITSAPSCTSRLDQNKLFYKDLSLTIENQSNGDFTLSINITSPTLWAGFKEKNGVINGTLITPSTIFYGRHKDQEPNSKVIAYDRLGTKSEGKYKNGKRNGEFSFYDDKGALHEKKVYKDDLVKYTTIRKTGHEFYEKYNWTRGKLRSVETYQKGKRVGKFDYKKGNNIYAYSIKSGKGKCTFFMRTITDCEFKDGRRIDKTYINYVKHQAYLAKLREEQRKREEARRKEKEEIEHRRWLREMRRDKARRRAKLRRDREIFAMKVAMIDAQAKKNSRKIQENYNREIKRIYWMDKYKNKEKAKEKKTQSKNKDYLSYYETFTQKKNLNTKNQQKEINNKEKVKTERILKNHELKRKQSKIEEENLKLHKKRQEERAKQKEIQDKRVAEFMNLGKNNKTKTESQADKAAFSACWQSKSKKSWFCSGPLQETYAPETSRELALQYSGCKNGNVYKHTIGKGKLSGKAVIIFNCNKLLGKGRDIFKLGIF